jgi:hypothetical protein
MRPTLYRILALLLLTLCFTQAPLVWSATESGPFPTAPTFAISTLIENLQSPVALVNSGPHLFGIDPLTEKVFRITLAGNTLTNISNKDDLRNALGLALGPDNSLFVSYKARSYPELTHAGTLSKELPPTIVRLSGAGVLQSIVAAGSPLTEPMGSVLAPRYFGSYANQLIVADAAGSIWAIHLQLRKISLVAKGLAHPIDVAFDINETLLVADAERGIVRVAPTGEAYSLVNLNDLGGTPVALAVHKCTGDLYIAVDSGARQVILKLGKRSEALSVFASNFSDLGSEAGIGGLEFSLDGGRLYIGDSGAHKIYQATGFRRCNRAIAILKPTLRAMVVGSRVLQPGGTIEYSVTVNADGNTQADNPTNELEIPIPKNANFVFGSITATSGYARYNAGFNRVEWNGSLTPSGLATITFRVSIADQLTTGASISAQGYAIYDENGDGLNESRTLTDDPITAVKGDPSELPVVLKGDIDGDGKLTLFDLNLLNRFFKKITVFTPAQQAAADVAVPCGRLNSRDYARISVSVQYNRPFVSDCDNAFSRYDVTPDAQSKSEKTRSEGVQQYAFLSFAPRAHQSAKLAVFDAAGHRVFESGWTDDLITWAPSRWTTPGLANGVYFYVLALRDQQGALQQQVGKFVVVK